MFLLLWMHALRPPTTWPSARTAAPATHPAALRRGMLRMGLRLNQMRPWAVSGAAFLNNLVWCAFGWKRMGGYDPRDEAATAESDESRNY